MTNRELCSPGSGVLKTCFAQKTKKRSMPCPNCEGYRDPKLPVYRKFLGYITNPNGIKVPFFTAGERPPT